MRIVFFKALPYSKEEVTLALESGVDGLIVPDDKVAATRSLARCTVLGEKDTAFVTLASKADEERAAALVHAASAGTPLVILTRGWEIIPVENLLACAPAIAVEAGSLEEAVLAKGVLERGVETVVVTPKAVHELKAIVANLKYSPATMALQPATITRITQVGMGHRVCVDTASLMRSGQGMLVGNSAAFTFLVNAETERNEYVAARPFRVNAGGVHAYALMPGDRTAYLEELSAGSEVLIVSHTGETTLATVGRVKIERRPMLLVEAKVAGADGSEATGAVFLQNAETIRLVTPAGKPVSVVDLKEGDSILCRTDVAGRHFGMRITEEIKEG